MIEHKLLYFPTRERFNTEEKNIADTSIAFIGDEGLIYTHKKFFGGSSGTGSGESGKVTPEWVDDQITNWTGRILDEVKGRIADMATKTYVDRSLLNYNQAVNITNTVKQILDAQTPSWSAIVSRIVLLENSDQTILELIASITALTTEGGSKIDLLAVYDRISELEGWRTTATALIQSLADADSSSVVLLAIYARLNNLENALAETTARINALATGDEAALTLEAIYSALQGDVERRIAAKIFLQANENGSGITLSADKIIFTGTNNQGLNNYIRAIVDAMIVQNPGDSDPENPQEYAYLTYDGIKFIDNSSTPNRVTELTQDGGLKHTITSGANNGSHGYWLKPDGSGELAFGNITWGPDGIITTHGLLASEAEAMGSANEFIIDSIFLYPHANVIKYHINKYGLTVKQGEINYNIESLPFWEGAFKNTWRYLGENELGVSVIENNDDTVYYASAGSKTPYHSGYNNVRSYAVGWYAYTLSPHANCLGIIDILHKDTNAWESIFKYSQNASESLRGQWIFNDGDIVYIDFPTQIYRTELRIPNDIVFFATPVEDIDSPINSNLENLTRQYATEIETSLLKKGLWQPAWSYRLKGLYDSTETYKFDNQYKDVVYLTDGNLRSDYYLCIANNTSGVDPETDTSYEHWCPADGTSFDLADRSTYTANNYNYYTYRPKVTDSDTQLTTSSRIIHFEGDHRIVWLNTPDFIHPWPTIPTT